MKRKFLQRRLSGEDDSLNEEMSGLKRNNKKRDRGGRGTIFFFEEKKK